MLQSQSLNQEKVEDTITWLRKILSSCATKTLQFEFSSSNVEILSKIKNLNETHTRLLDSIASERRRTLDAVASETERIESILARFGVSETKFSAYNQASLAQLVETAELLGIHDFSEAAFYTSLLSFRNHKERVTSELQEARADRDRLTEECADFSERIEKVQAIKCKLESEKAEVSAKLRKLRDERSSLKQKCVDYRTERRALRNKSNEIPFNLHHPVIVRDAEKVCKLREALQQIEIENARFEYLSPNVDEARQMIAESRALLDARTVQLSKLLQSTKLT